jgi:hypothetical protein
MDQYGRGILFLNRRSPGIFFPCQKSVNLRKSMGRQNKEKSGNPQA